jgi:hypothetical protein
VLSGRDGRLKKKLGCTARARGDTTAVALRIDHHQDGMNTRMMKTIIVLAAEEAGTAMTTHSHMADPSIDDKDLSRMFSVFDHSLRIKLSWPMEK